MLAAMESAGRRWISASAALVATLLFSLLLVAQADADARADAVAQFKAAQTDATVPSGWTGSTDTCTVGAESQASLDATLDTVNILRKFAGLGPVTFNAEKNHRALAAAMMMAAQGDLSHDPPSTWKCWTDEGHLGASTSNLYLGASGAEAMVGFVNDAGVDSLGHRRWVLDPEAMEMGSGSTGGSNALVVLDNGGDGSRAASLPADNLVGWPAPGLFPTPWIFEDWSVALGNSESAASISMANASVGVKIDGKDVAVSGIRDLGSGFGTGRTLAWRVALPQSITSGDHEIEVNVTGVTKDGAPLPVSYTVNAFNPGKAGGSSGSDSACEKAKAKLAKAKKKLKAAKQSGKSSKIKQAQKKVKKAKAKKKKACA